MIVRWLVGVFALSLLGACVPKPPALPTATEGWVAEGPVLELHDGAHDAARLGALTRAATDSGEVFVLRFDGPIGPTTTPADTWLLLGRTRGVLRVVTTLTPAPGMPPTAWTDTLFAAGGLVSAAYVIRTLEGHVAVDLHLAEPVVARARVGDAEQPLTIELRRGGDPLPAPALVTRGPDLLLLQPRTGDPVGPLTIEGYARAFENNVQVRVRGGGVSIDTFTTATEYLEMWGEYLLELPQAAAADTVQVIDHHGESGEPRVLQVVRRR